MSELAKNIGGGMAASGLSGVGVGIGIVFLGYIIGVLRNPLLEQKMFKYAILGFALTEAIGLFVLMILFLILFG